MANVQVARSFKDGSIIKDVKGANTHDKRNEFEDAHSEEGAIMSTD